jgi:hypothetical protein
MLLQKYVVMQYSVENIFTWIETGVIAIPEIQRPFVWDAIQVRDLMDSILKGYPIGYLVSWNNPNIRLKDGTTSFGKRILIDGQQRIIALMAALLGREVVDKNYETLRIRISYQPLEERFEVYNAIIAKDKSWIPDISTIFKPEVDMFDLANQYCRDNPSVTQAQAFKGLGKLQSIAGNQIGIIELAPDLDIETVTEIFIRVNSKGTPLSQADFVMSKIAVNETYGGNILRKAIDYFCHLAIWPDFYSVISKDKTFADSPYFQKMAWLKNKNDDLYNPSYSDMLRVAFTFEFKRGRLQDLVALLSGRNFETEQNEETIVEASFEKLKAGITEFMNETNFKQFIMIIRSTGFIEPEMITSQMTLNFAYILYLTLRKEGKISGGDIQRWVARWFVMSILTERYSASSDSKIEEDIKQIHTYGIETYATTTIKGELSDAFWDTVLPQQMDTSSTRSSSFRTFEAAQVKLRDLGFLSRDIEVKTLIEVKSDIHHLWPRDFLRKNGYERGQYNQIANFAITPSEINIAIGNKEPSLYLGQMLEQCRGGEKRYGSLDNEEALRLNLAMNCIPEGTETMTLKDYSLFLEKRRSLMAQRIKTYFEKL